jgi:hypothetical protein
MTHTVSKLSSTVIGKMTFDVMTLCISKFRITTVSIVTLNIMRDHRMIISITTLGYTIGSITTITTA